MTFMPKIYFNSTLTLIGFWITVLIFLLLGLVCLHFGFLYHPTVPDNSSHGLAIATGVILIATAVLWSHKYFRLRSRKRTRQEDLDETP